MIATHKKFMCLCLNSADLYDKTKIQILSSEKWRFRDRILFAGGATDMQ